MGSNLGSPNGYFAVSMPLHINGFEPGLDIYAYISSKVKYYHSYVHEQHLVFLFLTSQTAPCALVPKYMKSNFSRYCVHEQHLVFSFLCL